MTKEKPVVQIYCDGACLGNPGPGGWAALLVTSTPNGKHREKLISGHEGPTTNNRMELKAAIKGLKALKHPCHVTIFSDSQYVVKGMRLWVKDWQKRGWKTAAKKPVVNQDLWEELLTASKPHSAEWHWVKGHAGHPENERVDEAARTEAERFST